MGDRTRLNSLKARALTVNGMLIVKGKQNKCPTKQEFEQALNLNYAISILATRLGDTATVEACGDYETTFFIHLELCGYRCRLVNGSRPDELSQYEVYEL